MGVARSEQNREQRFAAMRKRVKRRERRALNLPTNEPGWATQAATWFEIEVAERTAYARQYREQLDRRTQRRSPR